MMAANSRPEPIEREAAHALPDHLRDVALATQELAKCERTARGPSGGNMHMSQQVGILEEQ